MRESVFLGPLSARLVRGMTGYPERRREANSNIQSTQIREPAFAEAGVVCLRSVQLAQSQAMPGGT